MAEFLGNKTIGSQFLGNKVILRTYKGDNLINEYEPLYNPPSDWSDIRTDCPANSIALYAAHKSDFSSYDNLGFTAYCTGGYNVYIDGTQYGSTYVSGSQCDITWSTSGITTGDIITTPERLKAHKIWIEPASESNEIVSFRCQRVAATGTEEQGILWAHFNISNKINLQTGFAQGDSHTFKNILLEAVTAKNNIIKLAESSYSLFTTFCDAQYLQYVPLFDGDNYNSFTSYRSFRNCYAIKEIKFKNTIISNSSYGVFQNCYALEKIKGNLTVNAVSQMFQNCRSLKILPNIDASEATNMTDFLTNDTALEDTVLNVSSATGLTKIGCYGTSQYFMSGFKGLRVSNLAPFNNATSPQINVSYTGLDRTALVQLFNDLPYNVGYTVTGSPTITNGVLSNCDNSNYAKLSSYFYSDSDSWEIFIKAKTPTEDVSSNKYIFSFAGTYLGLVWQPNRKPTVALNDENNTAFYLFPNSVLPLNTDCYFKITKNGTNFEFSQSSDGTNWVSATNTQNIRQVNYTFILGALNVGSGAGFTGSIDLNETYIKLNGVYWFRGQTAMTKTLSCVGATGTENLTQEDKDIALNKGWSLTLS